MYQDANYNQVEARRSRVANINGYSELIGMRIAEGRIPYFLNFMFNHIPGGLERKKEVMTEEVTRVHYILTRYTVRKPASKAWRHLRPIFIGCHDLPVRKNDKEMVRNLNVNGGLHFNLIALISPHSSNPASIPVNVERTSRLKVDLRTHFQKSQRFYLNERLSRVHVTPITYGTMADYAFKAFKNNRVSSDDVLVLN